MNATRVAIIDDHPVVREGIRLALERGGEFRVVGEGEKADDVEIVLGSHPDVIVLDLRLPGGGIEALRCAMRIDPDARVVILSVSDDVDDRLCAMGEGATAFVRKGDGLSALLDALRAASNRYLV